MGGAVKKVKKTVKKVGHIAAKSFDKVTGDALDLDKSKQREAIRKQRETEQKAEVERIADAKAEAEYQQNVASARTNAEGRTISADSTGIGVGDVNIDFIDTLKKKKDEDSLRRILSNK